MWVNSSNLCGLQPVNMSQRIYQSMKFFALLVFSFEMLAPAFVQGIAMNKKETATHIINATSNSQNQLCCLIAEEFGANEEDGEGHKEFVPLFDFDLVSVFNLHFVESAATSWAFVQHTSGIASQRPLFLLNRLFLI
ncbi:MAG: hypothetical protein HYR67_15850 [Bacteroidetes bacterium]|nr:hypothetical protein [Bacteroidota bacterium]